MKGLLDRWTAGPLARPTAALSTIRDPRSAIRLAVAVVAAAVVTGCVPNPYRPATPPTGGTPTVPGPIETQPVPESPTPTQEEPIPPPAPVIREPTLSPASRALVGQAQTQLASKNFDVAAASIERALRIEPDNPLLWIELGRVRQAEGNFVQAENMGRKAVSRAVNAPRAQSQAWRLIADSYRARGKNTEAHDADARAEALR